ncbi:phosphate-starvation-inducible PsiE family protein [Sulfurimonas sp. CS5]|uniref:phosphate-starvation-inducible PsiE family protein n=1 Tax=Sulfurimonas sp. CS5 TaxID=3391145 RepID=UPI0039E89B87
MKRIFEMKRTQVFIKFFITLILFYGVKDFSSVDTFSKLAVALLEFIIILELVRMLIEFLFSDENRIKLRLMVDSSIVFFMRDVLLIVNDKFDIIKILSLLLVIFILFIFRIITMKYSPSYMENNK